MIDMKLLTLFTIAAVTVLGSSTSLNAQSKSAAAQSSMLYEVSGKGLAKPSYIFGTFHAICPTEMVPFESLDPYLARTDQMLMEIDMDDPAEIQSMTGGLMISGGKTLKDVLTPEQFVKVDEMIKSLLGYSAENVKMIKPMMLTVMALTSAKAIGCTATAYDLSLMQAAVAKKKPISGLETVASQLKVIDSRPLEKQAKDLYEMSLDPQKSIKQLKDLMATYKLGDPEKLIEVTNSQLKDDKDFQIKLLDDRNLAWVPKLETAFKEKPTFVAVGAGHLGGKKGVLQLLREKGYDVRPVKL
jgi:uncharacterized protein YbaP (TraB family)